MLEEERALPTANYGRDKQMRMIRMSRTAASQSARITFMRWNPALIFAACFPIVAAGQPPDSNAKILPDAILATLRIDSSTQTISYQDFIREQVDRVLFPPQDATPEQVDQYARQILRLSAQRILYADMAVKENLGGNTEIKRVIDRKLREVLIKKLHEEADSQVKEPSEEMIQAYYQAHLEDFHTLETFKIQTVNSYCAFPLDEKAMQAAHEHIQKAWGEIQSGSDFIRVAIKYSNSPLPYRGETIPFSAGDLYPAIEEIARQLKNGAISPPFQTRMGYMMIRRIAWTPAETEPLTKAAPKIKTFLFGKAREGHWNSFTRKKQQDLRPRIQDSLLFQGDPEAGDEVLEFQGHKMTWGELREYSDKQGESIAGMSQQDRKKRINGWIENALLCRIAEEQFSGNDTMQNELKLIRRDLLFREKQRNLLESIRKDLRISGDQANEYVEKNPGYFLSEKQTRIYLLNIPFSNDSSASSVNSNRQKAEGLRRACEAREKLQKNEDVSLISAEYCGKDWQYDLDFAPQGPRGRIVDMAVEMLQKGEVSEPVEYEKGYYLIQLQDVRKSAPLPLDAAQEKAVQILKGIQARDLLDKKLDGILDASDYTINPDNISLLIDQIKG